MVYATNYRSPNSHAGGQGLRRADSAAGTDPDDLPLPLQHIIEGLNASLKRLQLDYVDVVLAHRPDVATPMEEVVRAFNHVIEKGLSFYWGTSEWTATQIQEAIGIADRLGLIGPIVEQPQYRQAFFFFLRVSTNWRLALTSRTSTQSAPPREVRG